MLLVFATLATQNHCGAGARSAQRKLASLAPINAVLVRKSTWETELFRNAAKALAVRVPAVNRLLQQRGALKQRVQAFSKNFFSEDARVSPAIAIAKALGQLHNGVVIPDYELLLSKCYRRFLGPGQVVFDVGSHAGFHLDQFISLVGPSGRAVAFEPIPALAAALAEKYREPNVDIRSLALADTPGRSEFLVLHQAIGMSGFKQRVGSGDQGAEKITVQVDTLDRQAADLRRLDYIKIDIEGSEISCLRGAQQTLARFRPFISVEYGKPSYSLFGNTAMTLFDWGREQGYMISDLFGNLILDADEWAVVCDYSMWDYFLVPQERRKQWTLLF